MATICFGTSAEGLTSDRNLFPVGQEPSNTMIGARTQETIRVWPTRVSSILNVVNLNDGEDVIIYTQDGKIARRATSGHDGMVQFDLSDFRPGVYSVSAGRQTVKVTKI